MVTEKRVNDGSKNGVLGYFCECGCKYWGIDKQIAEKVEQLHFRKVAIQKEANKKITAIIREEAKLLGLDLIEVKAK